MFFVIKDFLRKSKVKYYNIAIYYGMLSESIDKNIFIKAHGGNTAAAFQSLRRMRNLQSFCETNGCDGMPIPLFSGQISKCYEHLSVFLFLNHKSVDFVEVEKEYEIVTFDEKWLKSFASKEEIEKIKSIYSNLLGL